MKKRFCLALTLLALVAGGCVLSVLHLTRNTTALIAKTQEIEAAFWEKDYDACRTLSESFSREFTDRTRWFPFFMRHEDVSSIEETVITLPLLIKAEDFEHFPAELSRCRTQLQRLKDLEIPYLQNIL